MSSVVADSCSASIFSETVVTVDIFVLADVLAFHFLEEYLYGIVFVVTVVTTFFV